MLFYIADFRTKHSWPTSDWTVWQAANQLASHCFCSTDSFSLSLKGTQKSTICFFPTHLFFLNPVCFVLLQENADGASGSVKVIHFGIVWWLTGFGNIVWDKTVDVFCLSYPMTTKKNESTCTWCMFLEKFNAHVECGDPRLWESQPSLPWCTKSTSPELAWPNWSVRK